MQQNVSEISVDKVGICNALFPFNQPKQSDSYTDDEFDILLSLEKGWKDSLPHYTFFQLLEIYPGAVPAARRSVKFAITKIRQQISALDIERNYVHEHVINKAPFKQQRGLIDELNMHIAKDLEEFEGEIKKYTFYLAHLDQLESGKPPIKSATGVTDIEIERARMVPLKLLVSVTPMKKMKCLWHIDKHPSAHVYLDHGFCFVCTKRFDAIDVVRELYKLDFVDAVKWLLNI